MQFHSNSTEQFREFVHLNIWSLDMNKKIGDLDSRYKVHIMNINDILNSSNVDS